MLNRLLKQLRPKREPSASEAETWYTAVVDELIEQISVPNRAISVVEKVQQFKGLPAEKQHLALSGTYLLLEQFLVEVDPLKKYTRQTLRQMIQTKFPALAEMENFHIIFQSERRQELLLCRHMIAICLQTAFTFMGAALNDTQQWLATVPDKATLPLPLGLTGPPPTHEREWLSLLRRLSHALYNALERSLGAQVTLRIYEKSYQRLDEAFRGLETFPIIIGLLPEILLDEQKISLLSYRQIQRALVENVDELRNMNGILIDQNLALEQTQAELLQAQEAIMASSAQLRAVLNTVGDGIITFDADGVIVLVNQEALKTWGYKEADLIGSNITRLVTEPYRMAATPSKEDTSVRLGRGMTLRTVLGQRIELEGVRQDGTPFPLELHITKTEVNNSLLFTAAVNDIFERKLSEQTLRRAYDVALETSELKSRILAVVSHDLRTPLTSIIAATDMLIEEESIAQDLPAFHKRYLERIKLSGQQMNMLISDLLEQTQAEQGKITLHMAPLAPTQLLASVQSTMKLAANAKNLALTGEIDTNVPQTIMGDQQRLQQILMNLVNNSIKFTDEGSITVQLFCPTATSWAMSVRDTGCGMSKEAQATIFEPFRQVNQVATKRQKGLGLGLSIVKELVTLMQGDIEVVSEEGVGSTFTVVLPLLPVYQENVSI